MGRPWPEVIGNRAAEPAEVDGSRVPHRSVCSGVTRGAGQRDGPAVTGGSDEDPGQSLEAARGCSLRLGVPARAEGRPSPAGRGLGAARPQEAPPTRGPRPEAPPACHAAASQPRGPRLCVAHQPGEPRPRGTGRRHNTSHPPGSGSRGPPAPPRPHPTRRPHKVSHPLAGTSLLPFSREVISPPSSTAHILPPPRSPPPSGEFCVRGEGTEVVPVPERAPSPGAAAPPPGRPAAGCWARGGVIRSQAVGHKGPAEGCARICSTEEALSAAGGAEREARPPLPHGHPRLPRSSPRKNNPNPLLPPSLLPPPQRPSPGPRAPLLRAPPARTRAHTALSLSHTHKLSLTHTHAHNGAEENPQGKGRSQGSAAKACAGPGPGPGPEPEPGPAARPGRAAPGWGRCRLRLLRSGPSAPTCGGSAPLCNARPGPAPAGACWAEGAPRCSRGAPGRGAGPAGPCGPSCPAVTRPGPPSPPPFLS